MRAAIAGDEKVYGDELQLRVLPPVFLIATLTVMRGLFKFIQE
jgi:hypothetical protein